MKTPDEIKKGLECCDAYNDCQQCPYDKADGSWACTVERNTDALAYIQQLEAAQPKWISVEERLPEFEKLVLVAVNGKWKTFTFVNALQMATLYKDEGWIIEGFEEWDKPEVTHWMPAPEMP